MVIIGICFTRMLYNAQCQFIKLRTFWMQCFYFLCIYCCQWFNAYCVNGLLNLVIEERFLKTNYVVLVFVRVLVMGMLLLAYTLIWNLYFFSPTVLMGYQDWSVCRVEGLFFISLSPLCSYRCRVSYVMFLLCNPSL